MIFLFLMSELLNQFVRKTYSLLNDSGNENDSHEDIRLRKRCCTEQLIQYRRHVLHQAECY